MTYENYTVDNSDLSCVKITNMSSYTKQECQTDTKYARCICG